MGGEVQEEAAVRGRVSRLRGERLNMRKALIGAASALTVGLSGCGGLSADGVTEAVSVCIPYGGLKVVRPQTVDVSPAYEAECKDGKVITGRANNAG